MWMGNSFIKTASFNSNYQLTLRSDSQSARVKQERGRADFPLGLRNISY